MSYRTIEFQRLNEQFANAAEDLLNNDDLSIESLQKVLDAYNTVIEYADIDFDRKKEKTREFIKAQIEVNRTTLKRCYEKLNLQLSLQGVLLSTIHFVPQPDPNPLPKPVETQNSESQTDQQEQSVVDTQTDLLQTEVVDTQTDQQQSAVVHTQTDRLQTENIQTQTIMAQTRSEFLKLAGSLINYKFEGDPLKLTSFLNDIDLVVDSAEDNNARLCVTFIKSKISGRALEFIPDDANTIQAIKTALKENIKPESSDVVKGKMMSLKVKKGDFTEFTQEAEKLAEAFRRSLVISGISHAKAMPKPKK